MSMARLLKRAATRWPDSPAWIDGDRIISFAETSRRVNALASKLQSGGAARGDRVAMLVHNCGEGFETMFAAWTCGMAVVPANCRLEPVELAHVFSDSGAKVLVYSDRFRDKVQQFEKECPDIGTCICVGRPADGHLSYDELVVQDADVEPPLVDPAELAWIFYTSGTTGKPKGAMLSHRNLSAMTAQMQLELNFAQRGDAILHAAPITHGSGLCAFNNLAVGAANVFISGLDSFDPQRIFEAIQAHRITTMFLVPTMIRRLSTSPAVTDFDLSSLHTVIYGGAPMPLAHLKEAIAAFGPVFVQLYGQAEAPMACTALPKAKHFAEPDEVQAQHMTSAGREILGVEVAILDPNDRRLGPGEFGEICVRGDLVMSGYWQQPEASEQTLRSGWLHTGDAGHFDEHGYLYITDRIKDLIISGGSNIYPREVEEVLCTHPAIQEAAVVGIPDDEWGELVTAFVVPKPTQQLSADEIADYCRPLMASYKRPRRIEIRQSLPKSSYGKILRRELRDEFWAGRERQV